MTPLLLVPGMMCDPRMWDALPDALAPRPVLHALPDADETMAGIAAAILAAASPRFALAGLSLGGIVAMEMLHQAPERVERLARLDTNPWRKPARCAPAATRRSLGCSRAALPP